MGLEPQTGFIEKLLKECRQKVMAVMIEISFKVILFTPAGLHNL